MKDQSKRGNGRRLSVNFVARFLCLFGLLQEKAKDCAIVCKIKELFAKIDFGNRFLRKARLAAAKEIEQSLILHICSAIFDRLFYTQMRVYGTFLVSSAVCSALLAHAREYLRNGVFSFAPSDLWWALLFISAFILLLFPRTKTLASSVNESRILSLLFFDLLGVGREEFESEENRPGGHFAAFLIGAGLAFLTLWVDPSIIVTVLAFLLFLRTALVYPESALLFSVLTVPFVSDTAFKAMLCIAFCAYLLKALRGKRNLRFTLFGFLFIAFSLIVCFAGWVTPAGQGVGIGLSPVMLLGYFAASLMLNDKKRILGACAVLSLSAFISSLWFSVLYGLSFLPEEIRAMLTFLPENCTPPGFASAESFGLFVAVCTPFFLVRFVMNRRVGNRLLFLLAALPMLASVFFSRSANVWIVFIAVLLLMLILHRGVHLITALLLIGAGTAAYFVFSSASRFLAGFVDGFSASATVVGDQFLLSAKHIFAGLGVTSAAEGGSFYGKLLVSCGIVGVLLLFAAVLGAWGCACRTGIAAGKSDVHLHILQKAFSAAIAALMLAGIACDLFSDAKLIFLLCFLIGGLYAASRAYKDVSERSVQTTDLDRDFSYAPYVNDRAKKEGTAANGEGGERGEQT